MMIMRAGRSPFLYNFLFFCFPVLHACSFRRVTVESRRQEAVAGSPVGLGTRSRSSRSNRRREELVGGWIGVSEPAVPLQFANRTDVGDDRDIFKKIKC